MEPRIKKVMPQHVRRQRDGMSEPHLTMVRKLPCIGCGVWFGIHAHHLLRGTDKAGGRTAADKWAIPLCARCHDPNYTGSLHHSGDEDGWLAARDIDGRAIARALWAERGDEYRMRRVVERSLLARGIHA